MAQEEHQFEKLKIEKPRDGRRISSSLAALSLHAHHGDSPSPLLSPPAQYHHPLHPPYIGPGTSPSPAQHELLRSLTNDEFKSSEEDLSRRLLNGEDIEAGAGVLVEEEGAFSTASDDESFSPQHGRKASITFARETITSDGQKRRLEEPVPRSDPLQIPAPAVRATEEVDWPHQSGHASHRLPDGLVLGEQKPHEISLDTGSPTRKDSAIDHSESQEDVAGSLTSALTVSPSTEEPLTPLNGMLSPVSPGTVTEQKPSPFWPSRRTDSQRSRSYQRLDKAVNGGRRRSTRSANSSVSPASAFLSSLNRSSTQVQDEPDDEGQEIAGSGWIIGRTIGYGGFSSVKEVSTMDAKTAKRVVRAVKIMRKKPKNVKDDQQNERVQAEFEHEVALWRFLKHRYIVPLIAVYDTPFATFCITKLNVGGTLHNLVRSRRQQYSVLDRGLSAPLAKRYAYQLAAAIRYLHEDAHIVHRDIKLENCLLDMTAPDAASQGGNILLCDFGMADYIQTDSRDMSALPEPGEAHNIGPAASSSRLDPDDVVNRGGVAADLNNRDTTLTVMGSLEYAAPEVVTATETLFSPKADVWAYGVCVYALLTGSLPFSHEMRETLALMIEKSQWDITPLYQAAAVRGGGPAGMAAVDLVKGCLTYDSEERWSIRDVLESRWLLNCKELYGEGSLSEDELDEWGT
ncbi:uncharacterized protein PV09_05008 [Verruconis gallopava]|uniref:Protein kinase domain-containing protein n=1 Tax=Verruconis gallopava TaxID=253628 RepID=A0A0D2AAA2_9PEZI|nr:uncharacterized protein PV09_05008 [Verruconis gallopava]KIW03693.1 hypothetical protein PV09_05008 [Verruconis gallopava]